MANLPPSAPSKSIPSVKTGTPSSVEPLTRCNYKRLSATQKQIESASNLDPPTLIHRTHERDHNHPDHLSAEALVYFIRQADRDGDGKTREVLFRELLERCTPFFRGKFRGFGVERREDLQGEVLKKVVEDILAPDDRGDFMQVRFWKYLENKVIDAIRVATRQSEDAVSLDESNSGKDESEGLTRHETIGDERLSPEAFATIQQGLSKLPPKLRKVFLLRHYVGMKIGGDSADEDDPEEPTIARHFGCTGRTIRNWLKEAGKLLVGFREEHK